jgi:hypothetical protein
MVGLVIPWFSLGAFCQDENGPSCRLVYTMVAICDRAGQRHGDCTTRRMNTLSASPLAISPPASRPLSISQSPTDLRPSGPVIDVSGARPDARANPPDGGPPLGPNEMAPMPAAYSFDDLLHGLNPLHYVPVVGMIYRAVTGETVPAPERIAVSVVTGAIMGGPLGILGTIIGCLAEELWNMGPNSAGPHIGDPPVPPKIAGLFDLPDIQNGAG